MPMVPPARGAHRHPRSRITNLDDPALAHLHRAVAERGSVVSVVAHGYQRDEKFTFRCNSREFRPQRGAQLRIETRERLVK